MTQRGAPTTVFVHGFLDDAAVWRHVVEARSRPTPVALVDLAGMSGRPDGPGSFTLARWADDVVRTIDDVVGPVVLVGQSLGAQVAELAAVQRPDCIVGMALLTPVPLAGTPDGWLTCSRRSRPWAATGPPSACCGGSCPRPSPTTSSNASAPRALGRRGGGGGRGPRVERRRLGGAAVGDHVPVLVVGAGTTCSSRGGGGRGVVSRFADVTTRRSRGRALAARRALGAGRDASRRPSGSGPRRRAAVGSRAGPRLRAEDRGRVRRHAGRGRGAAGLRAAGACRGPRGGGAGDGGGERDVHVVALHSRGAERVADLPRVGGLARRRARSSGASLGCSPTTRAARSTSRSTTARSTACSPSPRSSGAAWRAGSIAGARFHTA